VSAFITSAFVGSGISGINVTVGDSNGTPNLYTPAAVNLIDNGSSDYNVMGSATGSGSVQATFTSIGANLSALSGGSVDLDVCLVNLP
jgi:hypothetical protein